MKYHKYCISLYVIALLKIVFTFITLNFSFEIDTTPLSIITIPLSFAMAFNPNLIMISLFMLIVVFLLWSVTILLSVLGIRYMKFRILSIYFICIISIMDFISSIFVHDIPLKILCLIVSFLILLICGKCVYQIKCDSK